MTQSHAHQPNDAHDSSHRATPEALAGEGFEQLIHGEVQRFAVRPATLQRSAITPRLLSGLQRLAGNGAVARLAAGSAPALQRAVYKEGGKGSVAVPQTAKTIRTYVSKPSVAPGGSNHLADVQNRGMVGFKWGKKEYAGGRTFDNDAQPDGNRLPHVNGQTYQEWDINPCLPGQNRGTERLVTSSDGKAYYCNDHYKNFTEF